MTIEVKPVSNLARRIAVLVEENPDGLTTAQLMEKTNNNNCSTVIEAAAALSNVQREAVLTSVFRKVVHE